MRFLLHERIAYGTAASDPMIAPKIDKGESHAE